MRILAAVVGVGLERLSLNHLHLVVDELQFHEAVGRNGNLIIVFALHDGFHRVVGIDFRTHILEVYHTGALERRYALHDGGHVTSHTTLFADGYSQVEMVRGNFLHRIGDGIGLGIVVI